MMTYHHESDTEKEETETDRQTMNWQYNIGLVHL